MSTVPGKGENLSRAVQVLIEAYQSIDLLMNEMDKAAEQSGFVSHTRIWLSRHRFDYSVWNRMPSTSDHWLFVHPIRVDSSDFKLTEQDGIWRSSPGKKAQKSYWGIQGSVAVSSPLVQVDSPETVRTGIFERLLSLPEV